MSTFCTLLNTVQSFLFQNNFYDKILTVYSKLQYKETLFYFTVKMFIFVIEVDAACYLFIYLLCNVLIIFFKWPKSGLSPQSISQPAFNNKVGFLQLFK